MALSPFFSVHPYVIAVALIVSGTGLSHAQFTARDSASKQVAQLGMGQGGEVIGQPPGAGSSSIIGSPTPGQSGSELGQGSVPTGPGAGEKGGLGRPGYPGTGSTVFPDSSMERNVVQDKLDRANREAADIDRNGRISPEEASRLPQSPTPPGNARGGVPLPRY